MVRLGVRGLLDGRYQVEEAEDVRGALNALTDTGSFDVAVVELGGQSRGRGGSGTGNIRALRRAMPGTGIVAHAQRAERHAAREALAAGASSYVAKSSPPEALERAIEVAQESGQFIDPAAGNGHSSRLTKRQRQILQLLANGLSTNDVADELGLSAETIRTHTKGMLARLAARDRAHAVAIAIRSGLID